MNNFFSSNLKFLRENKGLSKSELAKKINVHQSTISRWENEEMGATVDNAYDVANVFNISVAPTIRWIQEVLVSQGIISEPML